MKISDWLSPDDVMFDVRAANKHLLLQELPAKAAVGLGLRVDQVAPHLLKRPGRSDRQRFEIDCAMQKRSSKLYSAIV